MHRKAADVDRGRDRSRALSHERHGSPGDRRTADPPAGIDTELQQVITHHHDVGENAPGLLKLIAFADMAASCLFPYPAGTLSTPSPSSSRASTKR